MNALIKTELVLFKGSSIHGTGGFASKPIPRGACIIEYVGEKISKAESLKRCEANNEYIFTLDEQWDLDGSVSWNPARFINHSCVPNCEAILEAGRIWIMALQDIAVGEELGFNYGYDLVDYREHPCACGAANCVGFMVAEEFFPQVQRQREVSQTD